MSGNALNSVANSDWLNSFDKILDSCSALSVRR